jgi:hypothetical protein
LISFLYPFDRNHPSAVKIADTLTPRAPLLAPGEVLSEALNIAGKNLGHEIAVAMGRRILEARALVVGFIASSNNDARLEA